MYNKKHLILIGMMGTGKTTVGQKLAQKISLPWIDTDSEIEEELGMTIAQYFKEFGEEAFRKKETQILYDLLKGPTTIITTGGGIVLKSENRKQMVKNGWVIQLRADPEVIIERAKQAAGTRPLLQGNLQEKVNQIIRDRQGMYDFADWSIDTSKLSVDQVVDHILCYIHDKGLI